MPSNKLASYRYRVIDICLRNTGRNWSIDDLINKVSEKLFEDFGIKGVSERTIRNDLSIMKSDPPRGFAAPIKNIRNVGYYYTEKDFSINNEVLTDSDKATLKEVLYVIRSFPMLRIDFQSILNKVKLEDDLNNTDIVIFENNSIAKGIEFFEEIYHSILSNKVIEITFITLRTNKTKQTTIKPIVLKEYNNRWFVIGYNVNGIIEIIAIDRIELITTSSTSIKPNKTLNIKNLYKNTIGVTIEEKSKIETVVLQFKHYRAVYVKTKPLHHSQVVLNEEYSFTEFEYQLKINRELVSKILAFGKDVKVIKPYSLVETIKKNLLASINNYTN